LITFNILGCIKKELISNFPAIPEKLAFIQCSKYQWYILCGNNVKVSLF